MLSRKVRRVYLDHAAATPISLKALRVTTEAMKKFPGNPSAIHKEGRAARAGLEDARTEIAQNLAAHPDEIFFTSGATEANNLAIVGVVQAARVRGVIKPHIIISAIEHPSVLEVAHQLEKRGGVRVSVLGVDGRGLVATHELRKLIDSDTVLVSVMYANNEIGVIEPVIDIAKEIRHARKMNKSVYPLFHIDASQAANFLDINILRLGVDLMTLSSTKTYGPRGIGALFIKRGVSLESIMQGGKHESGRRPGTESPALALGFATALSEARAMSTKEAKRVGKLRDLLAQRILSKISGSSVNGDLLRALPNVLNISIDGVDGDAIVLYLDAAGIAVSGQSACKSSEDGPSHVIMAIGKVNASGGGAVRFSLGRGTTREDIVRVLNALVGIVSLLRRTHLQSDRV